LNYLNWFNLPSVNDTIVVKINGVSVEMNPILIAGFYMGTVYLSEGQTIRLEFIYNGVSRIKTNLTMVYVPNVTFPTTFKYDQDAFLSWSLNGNNQNQFAGATSEVDSTEQESDYSKPLSPSARAYTIPGYSVQNFGPDTVYELGVEELNFKLTNRICLMSYAADTRKYYAKNGELDYHKLSKRLNQLFTTMNQ